MTTGMKPLDRAAHTCQTCPEWAGGNEVGAMRGTRTSVGALVVAVLGLVAGVGIPPAAAAGSGPDLEITGTSNPALVSPAGGKVVYVLTVKNVGSTTVKSSTVTDTAWSGAGYVASLSDPCWKASGGGFVCAVGSLAPGASLQRLIAFTTPGAAGDIKNTAKVATKTDNNAANDSTVIGTSVVAANPVQAGALLVDGDSLPLDTVGGRHAMTLPSAAGAAVTGSLLRGNPHASLCNGPCESETVTADFPFQLRPVSDVKKPVTLELVFENLSACGGLGTADCHPLFWKKAEGSPGALVPFCAGANAGNRGYGIANPDGPCINEQSRGPQRIHYQVLVLSTDPIFGLR